MKLAVAFGLCAGLAQAQEAIRTDGRLSDDDFYRLVSCAAPVAGGCQKDLVRWSPADAKDISVSIVNVSADYPQRLHILAEKALDAALAEVNKAGASLHLTHSDINIKPDIAIYLLPLQAGDAISGTGLFPLDGTRIEAARAQLWWRADRSLINGAIVLTKDITPGHMASILLEEIVQAMGLLTDIEGDYYHTRSIFSDSSNETTRLGPQDIMVLRRHYP